MTRQTVSVVIPVRDGDRYLGEAIDSAVGQSHRPLEVIVVDDGSTDRSAEVAAGYAGVRLVRTPNRGPSAARNTGFAAAEGGIVAYLDADDVLLPDSVAGRLRVLDEEPETGVVLGRMRLRREPGAPEVAAIPRRGKGAFEGVLASAALVRRSVAERVPFDETMRLGEDLDWLFRLRDAGVGIRVLDREVLVHRLHDRNLSLQGRAYGRALTTSLGARLRERRERGG